MSPLWKKNLLAAVLISVSTAVLAEDIDLFVGAAPPNAADAPNVLIIMDNTANWTAAFANEKAALVSVVSGLAQDRFKVGLMMFSETGSVFAGLADAASSAAGVQITPAGTVAVKATSDVTVRASALGVGASF